MHRRRTKRVFKEPPPTPLGMVWRTVKGEGTRLIPESEATADSKRKMGNYDLLPQEFRDRIKERNKRS